MPTQLTKRILAVATAATFLAGVLPAAAAAADARAGAVYHVDCAGGSDTADGTSPARAWRSLAKASRSYGPGDRLLLKRGVTCTGSLALSGEGSAAEPIRLDAYGRGAKPHIEGAGARAAVHVANGQGWEIRNLDLSNTGAPTTTDRRAGLLVSLEDYGIGRHYVVEGVDVHDVNGSDHKDPNPSGGILFAVWGAQQPTRFDGVRITGNTVRHVDRTGIGTSSTWGRRAEHPNGPGASWEPVTGLRIARNEVHDAGGDGIVVQTAKGARVEHNYVNGFNRRSAGYNAGIWAWNSDDVLYQYNEVTGGLGHRDSMAFDFDGGNNGNVYQYNYSHHNDGGALLVCNGAGMTTNGNVFRHNISVDDGSPNYPYGVVSIVCAATTNTEVYSNTFVTDEPGQAMVVSNGPDGVTFRNNIFAAAPGGSSFKDDRSRYEGNLYWNTEQARDASAVVADPLFTAADPGAPRDVRLRPGSPALGTGMSFDDGVRVDFFGNRIPDPANNGAYQGS
ncbi:right-handed parallel beta-helix repeat-containing protein [Streptomyces sp. TRM66268-LWL]|uniref:Right-handed parallel beta-helix repeat-containing protein n=1 Tax=Streptomyces polyasparticus TaxID=2767826 RepID=A0ABR7SKC3_9ACTN|nr:right-handed parallel beta-helix repeat-containing protein [Streptomyces polyasparticus]MBC9715047.1 right-handed parallel beta-helix repeat-containing protein [Streptomyces polyasparticus]